MLTKFQHDVLDYFHECAPAFIQNLTTDNKHAIVVMDDLLPRLVTFLDRTIRLEIGLYTSGSEGYHKLIDMLIEVHIIKQHDHFYSALCNEMNEAFRVPGN